MPLGSAKDFPLHTYGQLCSQALRCKRSGEASSQTHGCATLRAALRLSLPVRLQHASPRALSCFQCGRGCLRSTSSTPSVFQISEDPFVAQRTVSAVEETADLSNPAAILYGPNDLRYEEHPLAESIAPGHVRVRMRAVGICGSDVHFYKKVCRCHRYVRAACESHP